ncbi:hypothetical protein G3260_002696 [Streptomyces albus]|uniref:hypothetical protein n=1 Tax=Streptomyces albus TaxID=1888 RepID=UPI0013B488BB|nr:hypothetical protein [Streptomyces albus]QID36508.1 hypothetical protein G3260_002696 [Streptomyces albus]
MTTTGNGPAAQTLRGLLATTGAGPAAEAPAQRGTARRAVETAGPARTVAAAVHAAGGVDAPAARRLRELAAQLGDSATRWLGVHDALVRHRGTLPALLAAVPAPAPPAAPGQTRPPEPRSVPATLALLLEHAAPEAAATALAALPDRTLEHLLAGGALPGPSLTAAVVAHGDTRVRTALARHPRLDTRVLARLLGTRDPAVGAAVFRNQRATPSLRRTLAHRLDEVPMDAALRAELTDPAREVPRTWLAPLLGCGDPQLVGRALAAVEVRGVAQQYALVRVWERAGADALRALLADRNVSRYLARPVVAATLAALDEDDGPGAAPRRLYESGEPYEDPARLPALLAVMRGTSSLRDLLSEPYVHDIAALSRAHAARPFMPKACEELARHEDASDEQRHAFRLSVLNEPWRRGGRRSGNITPPGQRLAEEELDENAARWAEGMAAAGLLDPAALVHAARPARHALAALDRLARRGLLTGAAHAQLRSLAGTHLGDRPAAWAAIDDLLPAHDGTLYDLITAAGRTAGPQEGPAPATDGGSGAAATSVAGAAAVADGAPTAGAAAPVVATAPVAAAAPAADAAPAAGEAPDPGAVPGSGAVPGPSAAAALGDVRGSVAASTAGAAPAAHGVPGPGVGPDAGNAPGAGAGAEVGSAPAAGAGAEVGSVPAAGAGPDSGSVLTAEAGPDTGSAPAAAAGPDIGSGGAAGAGRAGEAGAAAGGGEREAHGEAPPATPPAAPRGPVERAALAALDLLRSLAGGDAPLPEDPGVLRFLARHSRADAPGLATPVWLRRACAAQGIRPPEGRFWYVAPLPAQLRNQPLSPPSTLGSSAVPTERAYLQGIVTPEALLDGLPARHLLQVPYDWRRFAFVQAWRDALARRLRAALGTDADAWLRLAATAAARADRTFDDTSPDISWLELIRLATAPGAAGPRAAEPPAAAGPARRPAEAAAWFRPTHRPRTPDEALRLLEHGDHLWTWPEGTLLCLADAAVLDAVLPRLGPDGPWLLAAYLLRYDRTPRHVLDRLLAGRDPDALRVLAAQSRWLSEGMTDRLVDLVDAKVDLALLRYGTDERLARRIVARSRPGAVGRVGALVLERLRAEPAAEPAGGDRWLDSAEPELVREVLARRGTELSFVRQVLGCLRLVEHGGAPQLAALVAAGRLGQGAMKLCAKALSGPDPAAVLRARLERETAPARLVARLRRAGNRWQARHVVESVPTAVDWTALEAAHRQEQPLPYWEDLVNLPGVPAGVRLRHAALVREPGPDGLPDGAEVTRARARHGLGGLYHWPAAVQFDGLLASGMLSAGDLLHVAAPAAQVLAYLNSAARRGDAPAPAGEALRELAVLVRSRLGTDETAWRRVTARLTGRDAQWDPVSPVAALLD